MVGRIVSGGQTGVDRAALDVARELGVPCGGWCPAGRGAEDGPIPARYPLRETPSPDPAERTRLNVRDADATLILARGEPSGGTRLAADEAARLGRPCLVVAPRDPAAAATVRGWLRAHRVATLNVAGPRESEEPGIGGEAAALLRRVLTSTR